MMRLRLENTSEFGAGGSSPVHAAPVARRERIATLDILRGFALLGILAVNIEDFAGPEAFHDIPVGMAKTAFVGWHAQLDLAILTLKWLFVEGKMRAMFAMLFGAGCVLMTERFESRGQPERAADIYLRRSMWLALFGLIHGTLIWGGDILLDYGLCALLFLYPLRRVRPPKLIGFGIALAVIGGTFGVVRALDMPAIFHAETLRNQGVATLAAGHRPTAEQQAAIDAAAKRQREAPGRIAGDVREGRLPYLESIPGRADGFIRFVVSLFTSGRMAEVVGAMMIGMGLYRTGFFSGAMSSRTYLRVAAAGYSISIPIILVGIARASAEGFSLPAVTWWMYLPYCTQQVAGMLANASLLLLIVRKGWLRGLTSRLAAVGQTAFSNYILTSLICQMLFAWSALKLYGKLDYYEELYVVAAVWTFNLVASPLWLRFFAFGPLEWMWRSLTYWKRQPMLNRASAWRA